MRRLWIALVLLLAAGSPAGAQNGAARLGGKDQSSEYWDLTASFVSGHRLFARFSISNEGPGDRTAYAIGQVVFPDGSITPFQNGRLEDDWELSDDRLRMQVGSSVLDLHGPARHFEVDKNKKGVKIFLDFEPQTGRAARRWSGAPPGLNVELLVLGAPVRGSLWVRDRMGEEAAPVPLSGRATLSHSWMDESEFSLARRRIDVHLLAPADGSVRAWLLELLPKQGEARCWMVARRPDGGLLESDRFCMTGSGRSPAGSERYPVPASLVVAGEDLEGRVALGRMQVEHDPLSLAPRPFRWLLSFRADPLQIWLDAGLELRWAGAGDPLPLAGEGLVSFYFTNPLPDR